MKSDAVNWKQVRTMLLRVPNCFPKYAKAIELAELNATPASGLESTLMSPSLHIQFLCSVSMMQAKIRVSNTLLLEFLH